MADMQILRPLVERNKNLLICLKNVSSCIKALFFTANGCD